MATKFDINRRAAAGGEPAEILDARKRIASAYGLRRGVGGWGWRLLDTLDTIDGQGRGYRDHDHVEMYTGAARSVVIWYSPYTTDLEVGGAHAFAGFRSIAPLYHVGAATFMADFSNMNEVRDVCKLLTLYSSLRNCGYTLGAPRVSIRDKYYVPFSGESWSR